MSFRFTAHAIEQMNRRRPDGAAVERVLANPGQVREERLGREALQSRVHLPDSEYLLRAIVDRRADPPAVVTIYRTRYIAKYWKQE